MVKKTKELITELRQWKLNFYFFLLVMFLFPIKNALYPILNILCLALAL